jgi:fatty-acid peroxygenase
MPDVDAPRQEHEGVPARAGFDRTAGLLFKGYPYLAERRRRWGRTRARASLAWSCGCWASGRYVLAGRTGWGCSMGLGGSAADAIPRPLARTLFGKGAVHTQDGEAHRHRRAMFLSLLDPTAARELAAVADRLWQAAVDRWRDGGRVVVFDEAVRVIGVAICGWTGLPLTSHNARRRVWDLEPIWVGSPDAP